MKKFLLPGILAVIFLFLPLRSQAVPQDVPYQILVSTVAFNTQQLIISTANFPSANTTVNSLVGSYQWCIEHAVVNTPSAGTFTMFWSTSTLNAGTTDYFAQTLIATAYDTNLQYRTPYCAPVGQAVLNLKSSVAGSTITAQGYLWKGWNP